MLTLEEVRSYINHKGRPLCPDEQWCAINGGRMTADWVQVGTSIHPPGTSHVKDCGGYPSWGDNA